MFVGVIDTEECAGESCDLSEADEERFADLSLRVNEDPAEEENQASEGEDGGGQKLYVEAIFHKRFLKSGAKVLLFLQSCWCFPPIVVMESVFLLKSYESTRRSCQIVRQDGHKYA